MTGAMHDGFLVLPKAQVYVSVLINTESEDASPEWIAYAIGDAAISTAASAKGAAITHLTTVFIAIVVLFQCIF
jgi:hypothetical protein